jgi:hypothetical protein
MSNLIDLDQVELLKVDGNKEFNHGVDCCINTLLKQERVQAIPLDEIKKVREEIRKIVEVKDSDTLTQLNIKFGLGISLAYLDELIGDDDETRRQRYI